MVAGSATTKILLVDDNPANLLALEATLQSLGCPLVTARSGREALDKARDDDFALVLLDVHMPGLDGYETCRALRADAHTRTLPVIFLTAIYNDREHEASGYDVGALDYINKPFDPTVLKAKVRAFMALHEQKHEIERQAIALRAAERKAADEQAARQSAEDASRAKDHFLAIMSHELRTPLNTILGWAELLRASESDDKKAKALDTIIRSGRTQNRLIEDLLDSSRIAAGKLKLCRSDTDLIAIVDGVIAEQGPLAAPRGIGLRLSSALPRLPLDADPQRLRQVVWNLLTNAIKFSKDGGTVDVRVSANDEVARLEVEDHGAGISAAFLPFVFDSFRQANTTNTRLHGGLGLGLSIVRHLVDQHGGTVAAKSEGEGMGASFIVELPRQRQGQEGGAPRGSSSTGRFHALRGGATDLHDVRVLFVDDEEDARELVGELLRQAGAQVTIASSVGEAMLAVDSVRFDVVVSDLSMPQEDGYSFARRIGEWSQRSGESLPAIALSAFAAVEDRERALEAGFATHIAKPFDPARLMSLISALATRRQSSS
jgi:signal transduction histidine kinase